MMMVMAASVGLTLKGHGRDRTFKGHAATSHARHTGRGVWHALFGHT
jgi:hypothetical protein